MSPRLNLQSAAKPLLLAGALWSAGLATPVGAVGHVGNGAGRPQTPPPCGPDGVCVPNIPTYGWYQTRWRTFPGDAKGVTPDEMKKQEEKDEQAESMTGPRTPTPAQEGTITRERPKRAGQPAAEGGPVPDPNEDIRNLPGLPPLPGPGDAAPAPAGPVGGPAPAPAGGLPIGPAGQPAPAGTQPEGGGSNMLDPFGAAPPAPPWLSQTMTNPAAGELVQLPYVQQAGGHAGSEVVQPVDNIEPVLDGPNLRGEDAPPALPPALQRLSGIRSPVGQAVVAAPALPPALAPTRTAMVQPSSVQAKPSAAPASLQPSRYIQQASAVVPVGGHVVSPMGTMDAAAAGQGAQQAIYIEAGVVK